MGDYPCCNKCNNFMFWEGMDVFRKVLLYFNPNSYLKIGTDLHKVNIDANNASKNDSKEELLDRIVRIRCNNCHAYVKADTFKKIKLESKFFLKTRGKYNFEDY